MSSQSKPQPKPISIPPTPTAKSRSIRFSNTPTTTPRPQSQSMTMSTRSITARPMLSTPSIIRRSTTICPTIDVKQRRLVGRAPPVAQFDIITPPRSPTRLPQRTKSMNVGASPRGGSASVVPRRSPSVSTTEAQEFAVASVNCAVRGAQRSYQKAERGQQRRLPLKAVFSSGLERPVEKNVHPPGGDPGPLKYPQLTPDERDVLMHKLRVLLKCVGVDGSSLEGWDKCIPQDTGPNNTGRVFGTSVHDSSAYASCQVVLGDHTHTLPTCVFASVEEICRRGITTPALFRLAPSPTERTLEKLTSAFDEAPCYGSRTSLVGEDISNICALLKLYLRGLPEPVFASALWPILQQITSAPQEQDETARIASLQALLHLHPPTSFSLLIYLLAFLHHLLTHSAHNGLTIPTLASLFGPALFSPRTRSATGRGCVSVMSPKLKPEGPVVLVKTFLSAKEGEEGVRVLSWILERWESVAAGLLDVDVARDMDLTTWETNFLASHPRKASNATESDGYADSDTVCSDSQEGSGKRGQKYRGFSFPASLSLEQVPVREVRNSIVIMEDAVRSTRVSSPATLWSQETGSNKDSMSRVGSLQCEYSTPHPNVENQVVAELRKRMDAQEEELTALRHELRTIRERFAFPFPPSRNVFPLPSSENALPTPKATPPCEELDEDMMPTPRPPSKPHCDDAEPTPALELVLDSEPTTPLFQRTIQNTLEKDEDTILHPGVFADLGPSSPDDTPPSFFVVNKWEEGNNRSSTDKCGDGGESAKGKGTLDELFTARDALRSALAAMEPVEAQLRFVEKELEARDSA